MNITNGNQSNLSFFTSLGSDEALERMTIDNSGNIGIGDTTPDYLLDVAGTSGFDGLMTMTGSAANIALGSNYLSGDGGDEGLAVDSTGVVTLFAGNQDITPDSSGTSGQLVIDGNGYSSVIALDATAMYIGHNASSRALTFQTDETDRLTITGAGNVGIGTTNPGEKLDISGGRILLDNAEYYSSRDSGGTARGILSLNGDDTTILQSPSGNDIFLKPGTVTTMTLKDGGNVGIGDTSPDYLLDVAGTAGFDGLMTMTGSAANIALGSNFLSGDGDDEGVFVDSSGNVGIGTAAPVSQLTIQRTESASGGDGDSQVTLISSTGGNISSGYSIGGIDFISNDLGNATTSAQIKAIASASHTTSVLDTDLAFFTKEGTTISEKMRITDSGNVGIGTTSPSAKLTLSTSDATGDTILFDNLRTSQGAEDVFGSIDFSGSDTSANADGVRAQIRAEAATASGAADLVFSTANAAVAGINEIMRIDYFGRIGIGTITPAARLSIQTKSTMDILNLFETSGTEVFTVLESGNVGIGTTAPGQN